MSLKTQINDKDLRQIIFNLVSKSHKVILKILWLEETNLLLTSICKELLSEGEILKNLYLNAKKFIQ